MISQADRELLQAYMDGSLAEESVTALESRLKTEPAFALAYVALAREEAVCRRWAALAAVNEPEPNLAPTRNGQHTMPIRTAPTRAYGPLAAAAAVLLALGGAVLYLTAPSAEVAIEAPPALPVPPTTPRVLPVAHLTQVQGYVYLDEVEPVRVHTAQGIRSGQSIRVGNDGSAAVIRYDDGTSLELGPLTSVRVEQADGKRVFLASGVLTADVAKQAVPMILTTPHAEIKVLGTRFCSISGEQATQVELEEGKIELTRKSDGQTIEVRPGAGAIATTQAGAFTSLPLPPRITREQRQHLVGEGPVLSLATSPDNQLVAAGGWHGTVNIWNLADGQGHRMFGGHSKKVRALVFTPDSKRLISASEDGQIRVWNLNDGSVEKVLTGHRDQQALAVSPDGAILASGGSGRGAYAIQLTDLRTLRPITILKQHQGSVTALAFTPDGKFLASAAKDGQVKLWDLAQQSELASLPITGLAVNSINFAPNGMLLAVGTSDGAIQLWDWRAQDLLQSWQSRTGTVTCVRFSPDGTILASSGGRGCATIWDLARGVEGPTIQGHQYMMTVLSFTADGKALATAGWEPTIKLWSLSGNGAVFPKDK